MNILQTERLQLREMTTNDAPFIFELVNTPGWHRFIGDRGVNTIEDAATYIEENYLSSYASNGYGAYVVILKETGLPIGSCGLYKRAQFEHPDIGYAFLPKYTRKGYALEAARGVMEMARSKFEYETILAVTTQDNVSSIRLLNKIGLQQVDTVTFEGEEVELFLFSN